MCNKCFLLYILTCFLILGNHNHLQAQGCSDAGVCTLNNLNHTSVQVDSSITPKQYKHTFRLGIQQGLADYQIVIFGSYAEYSFQIAKGLSMSARINLLSQNGSTTNTIGLSDIYLTGSLRLFPNITLTGGYKLPLNRADATSNNLPLPMDYQTSLGTTDIILGALIQIKKLAVTVAMQQPITKNFNAFYSYDYPTNHEFSGFQSTNDFKRKGDIILRATYGLKKGNWSLLPGVLGIYHYDEDEFTESSGFHQKIAGSKGLTLNATFLVSYSLNDRAAIETSIGAPFVTRAVRPEGLTRKYVLSIEYKYLF